jgi:drug/metabolite transporter (DMT)-like permease
MTETPVEKPVLIFILAIFNIVIFSAMNVCVKLSSTDYSMAQIIFFRNFLAFFPILFLMSRGGGRKLLHTTRHSGHIVRGAVGITAMFFYFYSFALLPLADATAIHFASPLIITILSIPLLGERVGFMRWTAVIIGLAAVLFMLQPNGENYNLYGSVIALIAAFLGALAMIFVRHLGRTEHALTIVFYFTLYGTLIGAAGMVFFWEPIQKDTFFYLVMAGFLGGVGQVLLTYCYAHAPPSFVAPFMYLTMFFAAGFDILIWNVWPDRTLWIGSAVIIVSGLFIVYREAQKKTIKPTGAIYGFQPAMPTEKDKTEVL